MKIKGMFPAVTCKNSDDLIEFAEKKFGFKVNHTNHAIISEKESDLVYIMGNDDKVRFDIIHYDVDTPICGMCINVDDFDEALSIFKEDGFVEMGKVVFANNAKKVLIKKSGDIPILLIQHIKN